MATQTQTTVDKIVDKLPDGNHAVDVMANLATQISNKVIAVAPKALDYILQIKIVDSVSVLVGNLLYTLMFLISAYVGKRLLGICHTKYIGSKDYSDEKGAWGFARAMSVVFISGALLLAGFGAIQLFDVWTWTGIIKPDLAIAHDVYNSVIHIQGAK
jgi:hypothetical protein